MTGNPTCQHNPTWQVKIFCWTDGRKIFDGRTDARTANFRTDGKKFRTDGRKFFGRTEKSRTNGRLVRHIQGTQHKQKKNGDGCFVVDNDDCFVFANDDCFVLDSDDCFVPDNDDCFVLDNDDCFVPDNDDCSSSILWVEGPTILRVFRIFRIFVFCVEAFFPT